MKVAYPNSRTQHYKLPPVAIHRHHPKMNIDDILEYGIREQDQENNGRSRGHPQQNGSFTSFLNPHAPEYGSSVSASIHSRQQNPNRIPNPPTFSFPPGYSHELSQHQSYSIQEPEESLALYPHSTEGLINENSTFYSSPEHLSYPTTSSCRGASHGMSRSQDYFDEYNTHIHQQRPHFSEPSLMFPHTAVPNPPLRTRSAGNVLAKAPSFRSGNNVGPFSDSTYQSQMAFSVDHSLSSFGEDVHEYSPLRTPTMAPGAPSWSSSSLVGGTYPSNLTGPPSASGPASTGGALPKSKDQRKSAVPIDGFIYQVQFKRAHRNFVLAPSAPRDIIPGDFVKVEADRGEDMGIVLAKIPMDSFEEVIPTAGYRGRGFSSGQGERKFLYRRANAEERKLLIQKVADEEKALETVCEKSREKSLPMKVLDAEYQFDRHKLIFYFEADKRIDFRDLVSELFSQYKTRIWMQQVDTSSLPIHDPGTDLARATGFLPPRDDDFTTYGRTPSYGSAATITTLDTHSDSSKAAASSLSGLNISTAFGSTGANSTGQALPSPTSAQQQTIASAGSSSSQSASLFADPWGTYRF